MASESAQLTNWLSKTLEDDYASDSDSEIGTPAWFFPTDEVREEYISTIDSRPEDEVRRVIERMLTPAGAFSTDSGNFELYIQMLQEKDPDENTLETLTKFQQSEHMRRVIAWFMNSSEQPPQPGTKWVLGLLPDHPIMALNVLEAFFVAYMPAFFDQMVWALRDAEAVIRARYIGVPESATGRVRILYDLSPREFEQIVEHLYVAMGYGTQLTPPSNDGGQDIIVASSVVGRREYLIVECKKYQRNVDVKIARELLGVVSIRDANKGVLVTTADFTRGAKELAAANHRLELINGPRLVVLLNEHLGNTWPAHIEYLARDRPLQAE